MNSVLKVMYVFALTIPLLLQSCVPGTDPNDGACANGFIQVKQVLSPTDAKVHYLPYVDPVPTSTDLYYQYSGTTVNFIQSYNLTNICCKEHLSASFECQGDVSSSSVPVTMLAEIFWFPGFPTVQKSVNVAPGQLVLQTLEAGLYQKFKETPGSAELSITIQFETRGSIDLDIAFLKDRVREMTIRTKASRWAP